MWRIDQHTADVRVVVSAPSFDELFAEAVRALNDVMHPLGAMDDRVSAEVVLESPDMTSLLIDFLNEVLTRAHIERAAFDQARFASLSETALRATIGGVRCAGFEEDVKSVTYHEAYVERAGAQWTVRLVFDI